MTLCALARGALVAPTGRRLLELDLRLGCGKVVVIYGPNGVGKTLLLRRLAGLGPGKIKGEVWSAKPHFYAPPGDIHLNGVLVREWYWLHGQSIPLVLQEKAGLGMESLSRGWRRLAGLLAPSRSPARVMLLDEPFTGLDDERGYILARVLSNAAARGSLVVVAEPTGVAPRVLRLLTRAGSSVTACLARRGGELVCP